MCYVKITNYEVLHWEVFTAPHLHPPPANLGLNIALECCSCFKYTLERRIENLRISFMYEESLESTEYEIFRLVNESQV